MFLFIFLYNLIKLNKSLAWLINNNMYLIYIYLNIYNDAEISQPTLSWKYTKLFIMKWKTRYLTMLPPCLAIERTRNTRIAQWQILYKVFLPTRQTKLNVQSKIKFTIKIKNVKNNKREREYLQQMYGCVWCTDEKYDSSNKSYNNESSMYNIVQSREREKENFNEVIIVLFGKI